MSSLLDCADRECRRQGRGWCKQVSDMAQQRTESTHFAQPVGRWDAGYPWQWPSYRYVIAIARPAAILDVVSSPE